MAVSFVSGLDLGQQQDHSALAVLQRDDGPQPVYDVRYLARWPLGTPYVGVEGRPGIGEQVKSLLSTPPLPGSILCVDATGVGIAVVDVIRRLQLPATLVPVTITSGQQAHQPEGGLGWNVPKRDLVGVVQTLLQTDRLRIAAALPLAETLKAELEKFQVKITQAGNETFSAWREHDHDDLVLAVALACWTAQRFPAFTRESIGRGGARAAARLPRGESLGGDFRRWPKGI